MKNKVEISTCLNDTLIDSAYIELEHKGNIKDQLQILADYQKRYTNENCDYSNTIRNFKPVLAVFHVYSWGWETGCKVRFFDKTMLDNHQINEGFSDEPKNEQGIYRRTVYKIENNKISESVYKLETE